MNQAALSIRPATERDVPRLIELNRLVQDLHVAAHPDVFRQSSDLPGIEDFFSRLIPQSDQYVLLAVLDGSTVGYLCATVESRPAHTFVYDATRLYVHQIAVASEYRGRGVGRALFADLERIAGEKGIEDIALDTWGFNRGAREFFEALGYSTFNIRMWKRDLGGQPAVGGGAE